MNIFIVLNFLGGIAFFLFGMSVMSGGLEKMAGGKLEALLSKMTSSSVKGLLLGAGITMSVQSSSAVTVMLVGLVNSGIMALKQTIPVIMGSNIGTTVTSWLLSLAGISSDNLFIRLLTPAAFAPAVAFAGVLAFMLGKKPRLKDAGYILVGFGILMYGMEMMKNAVSPLTQLPKFTEVLTVFSKNPILSFIIGTLFTAIIQSSSASVGVLQALAISGSISFTAAVPIVVGQNVGTCITAAISAIGVNKNAKRVVTVHLVFNIIGGLLFFLIYSLLRLIPSFSFESRPATALDIAIIHTLVNVFSTAVLFPFCRQLEKLANIIIRDRDSSGKDIFLDERLILTAPVAVSESKKISIKMLKTAAQSVKNAFSLVHRYSSGTAKQVEQAERECDEYEDKLGTFLIKLSRQQMNVSDTDEVLKMLHSLSDIERLSDYALSIKLCAKDIKQGGISFSQQTQKELGEIEALLCHVLNMTERIFSENDCSGSREVQSLEFKIDSTARQMQQRYMAELKNAQETADYRVSLNNLTNDYLRIAAHCSNIALYTLRTPQSRLDTHGYKDFLPVQKRH